MAGHQKHLQARPQRKAYELSHCAIHPAGSLGSVGSVGPESGDPGCCGGVGAAIGTVPVDSFE